MIQLAMQYEAIVMAVLVMQCVLPGFAQQPRIRKSVSALGA